MTRTLGHLLLLFLLKSSFAYATCENDLLTKLGQTPNDLDNGRVTDEIPISVEALKLSYSRGIFPWEITSDGNAIWFSPPARGILKLSKVKIPRGDRKAIRKIIESGKYQIKYDTDFRQVITECALQARDTGRWISEQHIEGFVKLHEAGYAHSVEVWEGDKMVGGLYGVFINGFFSGESMFHKSKDVTKWAYASLIERLRANGHTFIDTQLKLGLNDKWGGEEVSRFQFRRMIDEARILSLPY